MIIEVDSLVKRYGELLALDHLSLSVAKGEIFGLLGPNGSGKTSAINCILALLRYDKGSVRVFGSEMRPDSYDLKRRIGVVMQNVAVFNELSVKENIDYFCGLYVPDLRLRAGLVAEAVEFCGLGGFEGFLPPKLSGGLLRRLNIACGIAHKPELIFLDEPTVAVDPQSRNHILEGIVELNRQGATVVYTSHYMEEVERICSRIMILDRGRPVASGTKESLKGMIDLGERNGFEVFSLDPEDLRAVGELKGIASAEYKDGFLSLRSHKGHHSLERVLQFLKERSIPYGRIYSEQPTLNDVFLELTGKELRDSEQRDGEVAGV